MAMGLKPIHLLPDFDLPVPRVVGERMSFPGKDQELARDVQRVQCPLHQIAFCRRNPNVTGPCDYVRRSPHFIHLPQSSLVVVVLFCFPRSPAQIPCIFKGLIVITPICCVLDSPGPGYGSTKSCRLRDEPVG